MDCHASFHSARNDKFYSLNNKGFQPLVCFYNFAFLWNFYTMGWSHIVIMFFCVLLNLHTMGFSTETQGILTTRRLFLKDAFGEPIVLTIQKDASGFPNRTQNCKAHKGFPERGAERKPLVISINNSDNLSRSNPCFVINNFNLIKEDIRMKNITKILITILSLTLLFVVGCGDRPTGSIPGKETLLSIPFLRLKVTSYLIILTTLIR